ncbi:aminotransferase class I/II-fold pyridoxal phosphate-dependent enzyme [Evansella sp. LMS18]|nr:aminotransferase class I/II-fold pyridoxal phosphate-dependent enzyme [Evansella sp. LMS18]
MKNKIFLSPPHMSGREMEYIKNAFETNWIAPVGPNLQQFEKAIAEYAMVDDAVAVSSGTAAIHLALSLLEVQAGDTVFCSSLTFVASANPILYQGAEPVFIDSEPETWNMSPIALERALGDSFLSGKLPKAVIVVNLYGQSAKMEEIISICSHFNVPVIEDAAESLGASYKGKASGTFGDFGVYSFNGNKIITTSGGGALLSNNKEALNKARFLATQARDPAPHYQHSETGYNYRMSNVLAGIGIAQLQVLNERVESRRSIFRRYFQELSCLNGIDFMPELANTTSSRWLTVCTINEEVTGTSVKSILQALTLENIEARPVWKPLHLQPLFKNCKYYPHNDKESISEQLFQKGICLPSGSSLTEDDMVRILACIKGTMKLKGMVI